VDVVDQPALVELHRRNSLLWRLPALMNPW
jgi:hypothetical protein